VRDAIAHHVVDLPHALAGQALRIRDRPVVAPEAGQHGADLPAAHRDEPLRAARERGVREPREERLRQL
jgi:hypothetical protein